MKKMVMEAEREGQRVTRDIDGEKGNHIRQMRGRGSGTERPERREGSVLVKRWEERERAKKRGHNENDVKCYKNNNIIAQLQDTKNKVYQ